MRAMARVGVTALVVLSSFPVRAEEPEDPVAAAEAAAKAGADTPDGKKFREALEPVFGREHGPTFRQCASETRQPDLSDFHLLLRIDGTGAVDQALVKPSTNLATCVQKKLLSWKTTVPPRAGFWVDISVRLKRK